MYKEAIYKAWLDIEFVNRGGFRARNVWAEIILYDGRHVVRSTTIDIPNIRTGHSVTVSFDTGLDFTTDFTDYEVYVNWE